MAAAIVLTKDAKIKKEIARLKRIFRDMDKNMLNTVKPLIENAAFMAVTLEELQAAINADGCTCAYKNGENQFGTKRSPEVDIHISMTRNLTAVVKQLTDIVPAEKRKDGRLKALRVGM